MRDVKMPNNLHVVLVNQLNEVYQSPYKRDFIIELAKSKVDRHTIYLIMNTNGFSTLDRYIKIERAIKNVEKTKKWQFKHDGFLPVDFKSTFYKRVKEAYEYNKPIDLEPYLLQNNLARTTMMNIRTNKVKDINMVTVQKIERAFNTMEADGFYIFENKYKEE